MSFIIYGNKEIEVIYDVDTVVVGGGTAGCTAAISSARGGNKTLIIEKQISLGGTQTNSLVTPMMPTYVGNFEVNSLIINKLEEIGCKTTYGNSKASWFNVEQLTFALESLVIDFGGEILYDTSIVDVLVENKNIKYIITTTCQGLVAIKGENFIDATGDALLSRLAGVKTSSGNENGNNQMVSFRFEVGGIDIDKLMIYMKELGDTFCDSNSSEFYEIAMIKDKGFVLQPLFEKGVEDGVLKEEDLRYFQAFTILNKKGCMSFNCPHIPGIYKNTSVINRSKAVIKGREMINRLVKFLIEYMPGFEVGYLLREASALGIRESYRIKGMYELTEQDYINRSRFEDGIAKGDWYIDVHSVKNEEGKILATYKNGEYYEIPYRSLITEDINNLIVVGRCISCNFLMQASVRIQPTLRDLGEVAGDACVYSRINSVDLNSINGRILRKF